MANEKRYDLGLGNLKLDDVNFPLWYYGKVVFNDDPYNGGRIKVRIDVLDNDIREEFELNEPDNGGLPWCQPLMPKFVNIIPKVGETVKIAVFDYRNKKIRREYVGPVLAQQRPPDFMNSPYFDSKYKIEVGAFKGSWKNDVESIDGDWKIYPDKDDISLIGRRNTDIILRNKDTYDEVILRSGKMDYTSFEGNTNIDGTYPLNTKNPAYITINHTLPNKSDANMLVTNSINRLNLDKDRTHINLVADNLNLISHKGSSTKGFVKSILKGDDPLTQIKTENEKLHPLVYGDILWDFLSVLRPYIEGHIHKASRREPDGDLSKNNLIKWFDTNMGTKKPKTSPDGTNYIDFEDCRFLSKGVKTN